MMETSHNGPEERLARYKKVAKEAGKTSRPKKALSVEAELEARIGGYQKEAAKSKKPVKTVEEELEEKVAGYRKEAAEKSEVKKRIAETRKKLKEIKAAKEEEATEEVKPENIVEVRDLGTGQVEWGKGEVEKKDVEQELEEKIAGYQQPAVAESSSVEVDRKFAKEARAEEAQAAYVEAYRKYDPGFTKNKEDDLIAVTRPPFFTFSAAGKELKRLHQAMVQARESASSEAGLEPSTRKDLEKLAREMVAKEALEPRARESLKRFAKEEEESGLQGNKKVSEEVEKFLNTPNMEEEAETPSLVEKFKSSPTTEEFFGKITTERGGGMQKRLDEIIKYFVDKYRSNDKDAHEFLMGQEIKGWFKGKEKRMQAEYKNLFNSSVYKEYLKSRSKTERKK